MPIVNSCSSHTTTTYTDNRYILSQLKYLNAKICGLERNANTPPPTSTLNIEGERIEFIVGDPDDNMMEEGDNILIITDTNIIQDTVEVELNGSPVSRKTVFPLYYTPTYSTNQLVITFNTGLYNDNLVKITYLKKLI